MLYNMGIVGMSALIALFGTYFVLALRTFRLTRDPSGMQVALLIGLVALFVGAYSNPYLGSFDFLLFVGILPYLTTRPTGQQDRVPPEPLSAPATQR
jgi:hypothetical protein